MKKIFEFTDTYTTKESIVTGTEGTNAISELKLGEISEYKIVLTRHANKEYFLTDDLSTVVPATDFIANPYFNVIENEAITSNSSDIDDISTICVENIETAEIEPLQCVTEHIIDDKYDKLLIEVNELSNKLEITNAQLIEKEQVNVELSAKLEKLNQEIEYEKNRTFTLDEYLSKNVDLPNNTTLEIELKIIKTK